MLPIREFITNTERLLRLRHTTKRYSEDLKAFGDVVNSDFTLAIVGKMKSGKSTLVNSLVGLDLAPVGINETTATVNWFRYGEGDKTNSFWVNWNTNPTSIEAYSLSELTKWVGDSESARRTRYIDFYCQSPLLKRVQIVDTPGSGSVLDEHQETLESFLRDVRRCDDQTNYFGGTADCLAYVLPNVAKESDARLLSDFASTTRLPGSTPYNSLGLIAMWETIGDDRPWETALSRADKARAQLCRYLSDVVVVSGPLFRVASAVDNEHWNSLLQLVNAANGRAFETLLSSQTYSQSSLMIENFSVEARQELRNRFEMFPGKPLPWPCFRLLLQCARHFCFSNGVQFRHEVARISGVECLLQKLESRFFSRSATIQEFTQLRKVLLPCEKAIQVLRAEASEIVERKEEGELALAELTSLSDRTPNATRFIENTLTALSDQPLQLNRTIRDLEIAMKEIREPYLRYDRDMEAMRLLDDHPGMFTSEQTLEILTVLGAYGTSEEERFEQYGTLPLDPTIVERRFSFWIAAYEMSVGARQKILEQVTYRLEQYYRELVPGHLEAFA